MCDRLKKGVAIDGLQTDYPYGCRQFDGRSAG
jgi:hypothetical protein